MDSLDDITGPSASSSFYATAKLNKATILPFTDSYGRGKCFHANGNLYLLRHIDNTPTLTVREDTDD